MKISLEKIKSIVLDLEKERGSIDLFALFLREEPLGQWDIVASAAWLDENSLDSYRVLAEKFQAALTQPELMQIARLVILDGKDPVMSFFRDKFTITNGTIETMSGELFSEKFGFSIKTVHILRCRKN